MKKIKVVILITLLGYYTGSAQIDANLLLELVRGTTSEVNNIVNPSLGTLVFNATTNKMLVNTATGFETVPSFGAGGVSDFWTVTGNTNTNNTHFLGTIDAQDMILRTNNLERLRLSSNGNIGINTDTPDAQLDIESASVPLRIQPSIGTPTGTQGGQIFMADDGILYAFDGGRNKWLSVDRTMVGWGRNAGTTTNEYLRQFNGAISSSNGWRMIRDGTITAISAQTDTATSWTLEIRKNDDPASIVTLDINLAEGNHNATINIDVNEGDFIQAYCNGTNIVTPQTLIEISWRR